MYVLFLPTCDVYVRSFLCHFYTVIKLYYTKALSDQALSLASDWILLQRTRILASFVVQQQPFTLLQGNLPHPGVKPMPLTSPALAGGFTTSTTWKARKCQLILLINSGTFIHFRIQWCQFDTIIWTTWNKPIRITSTLEVKVFFSIIYNHCWSSAIVKTFLIRIKLNMNIIMQNNSCFSIAMLREDIYFLNLAGISSQTLEIFKGLQFEG